VQPLLQWNSNVYYVLEVCLCGLGGSVGMAADYGLDGAVIESWCVGGGIFFAHVQLDALFILSLLI
jgi:hypothetical protein